MTLPALGAFRAEREAVLAVARTLSPEEWSAPSDASGWTVRDVFAHLSWTQRSMLSLGAVRALWSRDVEQLNEDGVRPRRALDPGALLAEYETWSRRSLRVQRILQTAPAARVPVRLGDIGVYPAHLLTDGFVFDHWTHLRCDVLAPLGPVDRPRPSTGDDGMRAMVTWILAGLPRMSGARLAWMDMAIALHLTGPGGGAWHVGPVGPKGRVLVSPIATENGVAATITSPVEEVPVWATHRRPWQERDVAIDGDQEVAARFLDSVRLV